MTEEDFSYNPHAFDNATFSNDRRFRYQLGRRWGPGGGYVAWVMLNPSTADAEQDDPTIRKCRGFAERWGFHALQVVNLYAWRATDPRELRAVLKSFQADPATCVDPSGELNYETIRKVITGARRVVAAWGATPWAEQRGAEVAAIAGMLGVDLGCIGTTASGAPRHPLMTAYATPFAPWSTPEAHR